MTDTNDDTAANRPDAQPPFPYQPQQPHQQQPYAQQSYPQQPYPQQPFAYAAAPAPAQRAPRSPEERSRRRRLLVGLVGGGALLLVLLVAGAVTFATMSASHRPEAAVRDYLGAVASGDVERALQLDGTEVTDADVLLTNEAYAASGDHVDGFRLGDSTTASDAATVSARVHQSNGSSYPQEFTLTKTGTDLLVFDVWSLEPVTLGALSVQVGAPASAEIEVVGVPVPRDGGTISLRALPGTYDASLSSENEWFTATSTPGTVTGPGSASTPAVVTAALTPTGLDAANASVDAWVAGCIASTDIAPTGCSFGLIDAETEPVTLSNQTWTLEAAPQYSVGDWQGDGWAVDTAVPGSATFAADAADSAGNTGTYSSLEPVPVVVGGVVTDVTADGATYTSSVTGSLT